MPEIFEDVLARKDDTTSEACGFRLEAAILSTGMSKKNFAEEANSSRSAVSNAISGSNYPSNGVMSYLFRRFRIDYNFILGGHYSQLPGDVQSALFEKLQFLSSKQDRARGSS